MATASETEGNVDRGGRPMKLSADISDGISVSAPKTPGGAVPKEKGRKIGHRRVDEKTGTVTYKKKPTSELMAAIQLGIGQSVGGLSSKPERDLLMQDFGVVQTIFFPSEGSNITPAHHYSDFRFKTYAPLAFRYFRELFNIRPDDFMLSLCDDSLTELSNPGAGGSIFYISEDDEFIVKTAQHKEADFLQKLLPGYYMNLNQNPRTLLPKFYGLYCYQCGGKNIRFVVMNNILPSYIKMHEKYDLKGSTYKRKASKSERAKSAPTLKDLDFMDTHPEGILMEKDTYEALVKTVQRDCRVLESFKIMDYSLLVGIHNLDIAAREKVAEARQQVAENTLTTSGLSESQGTNNFDLSQDGTSKLKGLSRGKSLRAKVTQYSTPMESIQAHVQEDAEEFEDEDIPPGGIPAKNSRGERLLLYIGIIDILQRYKLRKKFEHTLKSMVTDGDSISVTRPSFYSERFQKFTMNTVFRKAPSPLKHSPSKRKPVDRYGRTTSMTEDGKPIPGTTGGRPDLLIGSSTPPPTAEALSIGSATPRHAITHLPTVDVSSQEAQRADKAYFQTIQQQEDFKSVRVRHSPLSMSESTPTYTDFTEGTPSYTASSPSCSSEVLDSQVPNLPLDKETAVSQGNISAEGSPSKVMLTSSSTSASYYSAASVIEASERDNCNTSSHVINSVGTNSDNVGRTVEINIGNGDAIENDYLKSVSDDYKHSKTGAYDVTLGTVQEPRVSVVSQKSSDTSFSTQSGYTDSVVSGYSESVVSHSTASTQKSGQSDSSDMSWNASDSKHPMVEVTIEKAEEESASTYL